MNVLDILADRIEGDRPFIVFPEGDAPVIREAAQALAEGGLARPVLLSESDEGGDSSVMVITPRTSPLLDEYVAAYCTERDMPESVGKRIISNPLYFAAMMVKHGRAGGMVAGIDTPTEEVIMASELIIGLLPGISLASSFFLMDVPGFSGGENGLLLFADPAVNPDPTSEELADIAISSAHSARELLGWTPKVAMLSFSTHGSADHPLVEKVVQATDFARQKAPEFHFEGEIQADAALVEAVASKKVVENSKVAGQANILIFPDLNAANIGSKLVQRLAGAASYGPVLQGFNKPVSDLSRGATVEDVVGASIMVAARVTEQD